MTINSSILKHAIYWLIAFCLLTFIYGTAYGSYNLGTKVILILLPVHMAYFYTIVNWIVPRFFFEGKYIKTFFTVVTVMFLVAVLYRLTEIFIADPFIYQFYKARNSGFTWNKINLPWWAQLQNQIDFVNAIERSNSVAWICVTLKLFVMWHERKQAVLRTELDQLKAQVHPHFLFNALNNLYSLSLNQSPQTPNIILGLSNILRYVLYECSADLVLLSRDIEILKDYITLEKIRYEERLELNVHINSHAEHCKIAPLLMLPLVENAFKHGAAETIDSPWINIELYAIPEQLILRISNSRPESNTECSSQTTAGGNIGLSNVQKRLELLYPGKHSLVWFDEQDCFVTEMIIQLPIN